MTIEEFQEEDEGYNPLLDWNEEDDEDMEENFGPAGIFSTGEPCADNRQIMAERYVDEDYPENDEDQPHFDEAEFEYEVYGCSLSWQHAERRMFVNQQVIQNIHNRECGCGSQITIVITIV
jgi:hypothetical protein